MYRDVYIDGDDNSNDDEKSSRPETDVDGDYTMSRRETGVDGD